MGSLVSPRMPSKEGKGKALLRLLHLEHLEQDGHKSELAWQHMRIFIIIIMPLF